MKWLSKAMVLAIHDEAVAMFGGLLGVRDIGLLESALDKPKNVLAYEAGSTVFSLAAVLCLGMARNHPFLDGNKRTALLSARAFLFLNGFCFEPEEVDEVEMMVQAAQGNIPSKELASWFERFSQLRKLN